jgi:MFS family permease
LNVAIPSITEKFHSTADIGWYSSGYLSTLCSFQPLSGKLYSNFSLKVRSLDDADLDIQCADLIQWTFLMFFLIFEFGSTLSGAATSSAFLIGGRATSGVGAAGLMSGTLSIIAVVVPIHIRALYTGVLSSMFGIAMISGPLIGGALTQHVSCTYTYFQCPTLLSRLQLISW